MDMSRVIPHTLDRTQSVCLQQSLSAHSSLSWCRCRHSHSLNNCKLTKRKMLSSFLLAHARGTRRIIQEVLQHMLSPEVLRWLAVSITTHAVDWKNNKSMMQCRTNGLCPCSRTTRAGVLRWSHATTTQINKESEYSILRFARCKRPCKRNFWSVQISIHQHSTNNTNYQIP